MIEVYRLEAFQKTGSEDLLLNLISKYFNSYGTLSHFNIWKAIYMCSYHINSSGVALLDQGGSLTSYCFFFLSFKNTTTTTNSFMILMYPDGILKWSVFPPSFLQDVLISFMRQSTSWPPHSQIDITAFFILPIVVHLFSISFF